MLFVLTKLLTWLVSPLVIALIFGLLAWCQAFRGRRRRAVAWFALACAWSLVWSSPAFYAWLGYSLEKDYPPLAAEQMPACGAIVVLGGGVATPAGPVIYPDMSSAADRVWHAARLYRAGKAPVVIPSGLGEAAASAVLLRDLGVPPDAIRVENASRNTAENATRTRALLNEMGVRRVLLVTSAFHMRRARLLFEKAGIDVIPAATDHEATLMRARSDRWSLPNLLPSADMLCRNTYILKEYIGYWVCRMTP